MQVKHDKEARKFYLTNDGKDSYLLYMLQDNIMNIYRTYVPVEQRSQGLAANVVKAALDFAKENNFKVIPTCSYTDFFIKKNKEYEDLLSPL
ncbi:MAG: N-acetyltransferase [Ignavibacteriales bacterium]|nr:MAG: N-acetyltransferase [Ignavibacteriales bacterium]